MKNKSIKKIENMQVGEFPDQPLHLLQVDLSRGVGDGAGPHLDDDALAGAQIFTFHVKTLPRQTARSRL